MVNLVTIILGTLINIIFSIVGSTTGIWGLAIGILISSYIIGNLIGKNIFNGLLHGTIIGATGAVIIIILNLINVQTILPLPPYVGLKAIGALLLSMVLGSVGGTLGSLIKK